MGSLRFVAEGLARDRYKVPDSNPISLNQGKPRGTETLMSVIQKHVVKLSFGLVGILADVAGSMLMGIVDIVNPKRFGLQAL